MRNRPWIISENELRRKYQPATQPERTPLRVKVSIAAILLTLLGILLLLTACDPGRGLGGGDCLRRVAAGVAGAKAHVAAEGSGNHAAKPLAGAQARPLLDQVSAEHQAAAGELKETD